MVEKQKTAFTQFSNLRPPRKAKEAESDLIEHTLLNIVGEYRKKTYKKKAKINWRDIADVVCSDYILIQSSDDSGICTCVTCGAKKHRDDPEMQRGHYRTVANMKTRYDKTNVHPQCRNCNIFKNGNYREYHIFMVKKYGEPYERQLRETKEIHKFYDDDYKTMIVARYDMIKSKQTLLSTQPK